MVTMGAEDLVTNAEDLYGDGPGIILAIISDTKLSSNSPQLGLAWSALTGWGCFCVAIGVFRRSSLDLRGGGDWGLLVTRDGFLMTLRSLESRELSLLLVTSSHRSDLSLLGAWDTFLNWWNTDFCFWISFGEFLWRSMCFLLIFGLELFSTDTAEIYR